MSQYDDFAEPKRGSSNTVLYVILGVVLVVVLVCGGISFAIYRMITGAVGTIVEATHQATVQAIQNSDMDDEDKEGVIAQVNRVADAYKADEITTEQVTEILGKVFQPPIIMAGMCQHLEKKYVNPSGLTDEEKADGQLTLQRLARGAFEKTITQGQFNKVVSSIQQTDQNGNESLKASLTDDELREFLADCKQLVDEKEIPEEPYDVDIGGEVKKIVDDVLNAQ